mmetsp:Transcript_43598/g.111452  ORF Transcript_43598/g.111452 Transcript_43598/m.111452 type:complete len:212 (+) Transcript_43598:725-1360(+)
MLSSTSTNRISKAFSQPCGCCRTTVTEFPLAGFRKSRSLNSHSWTPLARRQPARGSTVQQPQSRILTFLHLKLYTVPKPTTYRGLCTKHLQSLKMKTGIPRLPPATTGRSNAELPSARVQELKSRQRTPRRTSHQSHKYHGPVRLRCSATEKNASVAALAKRRGTGCARLTRTAAPELGGGLSGARRLRLFDKPRPHQLCSKPAASKHFTR